MAAPPPPPPPKQWGRGGESDEIWRNFCGHVNFLEMNGGISVYGGTKLNNHKDFKISESQKLRF